MGKMRIRIANALAEKGIKIDFLFSKQGPEYSIKNLDPRIRTIQIKTTNSITGVLPLAHYLKKASPDAILTQRIRVNILAHRAKFIAQSPARIYSTINSNLSRSTRELYPKEKTKRLKRLRKNLPKNDGLIAISRGVADDAKELIGASSTSISVAPNPVFSEELEKLSAEPVDHPWFSADSPPVIIGIGRLERQKDFPNLVKAFARFRQKHDCRLVILGKGPEREKILRVAREKGVENDTDLPGFFTNPYAFLARSSMFVLSSAWEGFGNALVEAMAVGTPAVSTNCPSGPEEILDEGRLGPLAPVGDAQALHEAMEEAWRNPLDTETLRASAQDRYSPSQSAAAYMAAMQLGVNK